MRALLFACLFVSCVDHAQPCATVEEVCGARPLAPGWSASFDAGRASMSVDDYNAIIAWRDAVSTWGDCAEGVNK